jgi:serine protease
MSRASLARRVIVAVLFAGCAFLLAPRTRAREDWKALSRSRNGAPAPEFREGQVLVRFRDTADERVIQRALRAVGGREAVRARRSSHFRVALDKDVEVATAVEHLRALPEVDYAEPNPIRHIAQATSLNPNDTLFRLQWNFRLIGAPRTWAIQGGRPEVAVAVIDTGIAYEDFGPYRKAPDWGSVRFLPGFDALHGDLHPNDDHGHGTHVASTIAEATNNALGVAGLAFGCSLMAVKAFDTEGTGDDFDIAEALDYVVAFREGGTNPVKVVNMSFGSRFPGQTLSRAIDRAAQAGLLLVSVSGNDGRNGVEFPAAFESVIAVGAVDGAKRRAPYSNFGSALDLVAPGGDDERDDDRDGIPDFIFQQTLDPDTAPLGRFDEFCVCGAIGTSSAAPHVSALAALLFSQGFPDARTVRAALETTAEDLGTPGRDDQFGRGLIQPAKALSGQGLNQ